MSFWYAALRGINLPELFASSPKIMLDLLSAKLFNDAFNLGYKDELASSMDIAIRAMNGASSIAILLDHISITVDTIVTMFNNPNFEAPQTASILNQTELRTAKAASILNNTNLLLSRAAEILNQPTLSPARAGGILDHPNLSIPRVVDIFNHPNLSVSRAAEILNQPQLSTSKAEAILVNLSLIHI